MADVKGVIAELRAEHDALLALVDSLDRTDLERESYAKDWTISQVLSHLGSGAEINVSNLRSALHGSERIPRDSYPELWGRWDHSTPVEQVEGFRRWHGELVDELQEIEDERLSDLEILTAVGTLPVAAVVGMRFREAAVHAWDIAVALDAGAAIRNGSAGILADQLPGMMDRTADPIAAAAMEPDEVSISSSDPDRSFLLALTDSVTLGPGTGGSESVTLRLRSEALVRLVYGRLDPNHHQGPIEEQPDGLLAELRRVFKGF